jgi:hypothetical protein
MARNWHQIVLICIRRKSGSEMGEHTWEVPALVLMEKLMRRRQTKNNQVYLVYGMCNESNGFKMFPTMGDLSRSPTLEGVLKKMSYKCECFLVFSNPPSLLTWSLYWTWLQRLQQHTYCPWRIIFLYQAWPIINCCSQFLFCTEMKK